MSTPFDVIKEKTALTLLKAIFLIVKLHWSSLMQKKWLVRGDKKVIYSLLRHRKIFNRITWTFSNFYGFPFKYILGQKMSAFGFCISMVIKTNVVSNMFDQFWQCNFSSGSVLTLLRWKQNCKYNLNKWMHFWCSWENCKYPNWIKIEACSFIVLSIRRYYFM